MISPTIRPAVVAWVHRETGCGDHDYIDHTDAELLHVVAYLLGLVGDLP